MKRGCTQCGECLAVCPVFQACRREEYSPKAKRLLMEPVDNNAATMPWQQVFSLARLCAGCGRCQSACARKFSTSDLLADLRSRHPHWTQFLWEQWIRRLGPLWPLVGRLALMVPAALTPKMLESSLATAEALVDKKNTPLWAVLEKGPDAAGGNGAPVLLFSGCTAKNVRPLWTERAEALLRTWGYTVMDAAEFTCCGNTMHHAGRYDAMQAMRRQNITVWKDKGMPRIAVFCASCFHGLLACAADNGPLSGDDAEDWKKALTPLSVLTAGASVRILPDKPEEYGYYEPCHWDRKDRDAGFLSAVLPGLRKGTGLCCGMGGILKMTDPDLSNNMAAGCLRGFPAGIGHIVTGCSGCAMQLSAVAGERAVYHWLDVVEAG